MNHFWGRKCAYFHAPLPSMWLVFLPFTKTTTIHIGEYTSYMDGMGIVGEGIGFTPPWRPRWAQRVSPWCSDPRPYLWPVQPVQPMVPPWGPGLGTHRDDMLGRPRWGDGVAKIERKEGFLYFDDKFIDENWVILVASSVCMCTFDYIVSLDLRNPTLYTNGKSPAVQEYAFACLTIFREGGNPPRIWRISMTWIYPPSNRWWVSSWLGGLNPISLDCSGNRW